MSLRRKDDWDEALEEARNNAIARGETKPAAPFVPGADYDYGISITISMSEILGDDTETPNARLPGAEKAQLLERPR